jgi:PhnB protein
MKQTVPFLTFNGNCREAITFYQKCFDAELSIMPVSSAPFDAPPAAKDLIMHATLTKGSEFLMAADTWGGSGAPPYQKGNNFSVAIQGDSLEENEKFFNALSEGGQITMPLQDMFWGARFGMLTDRFGIQWMFNCALPK